ncbi:MAG: metallophosphoesterase, partial [Bacteroidales bacterium]|nr:metallophosphoesterase [Bacteroidales bacterium]
DTYLPLLQQLQAVNGIYCVMGNHDYGSYAFKENSADYQNNLTQLQQNYQTLHWHLLNNEFAYIVKEQDTLVIAGTENQSLKKMFQSFGDIHQTLKDISGKHPIILMTHDPNYWTQELYKMQEPIVLTLSGHTHGMQIGMNTHWCRWSLYEWMMSPYWGGLYEKNGKYLYINLGLGQTAFPGRIGLRPEITVFKLISPSE